MSALHGIKRSIQRERQKTITQKCPYCNVPMMTRNGNLWKCPKCGKRWVIAK
jgi:ribosomal protein L37AE/L43A